MKDFLYISHRFKNEDIPQIEKILEANNLLEIADFKRDGILAGFCSIRLPINDKRLNVFKNLVGKDKAEPFIRIDREYSKTELDNCEYLVVNIATSGLENPVDSQSYDFRNACKECGSGLIPNEQLVISKNSMGKKLLDNTAHNQWLVFNKILAEKIEQNGFSGISFKPIKIGRNDNDYNWGKIDNILPKLNSSSKYRKNHSPCMTCGKSGNFENFDSETRFVYDKESFSFFQDFNLSYEYFGEWKFSKMGGSQLLIISQNVRQFMIKEKVRFLAYKPIELNK